MCRNTADSKMDQSSDNVGALPILQKQLDTMDEEGKKSPNLLGNQEQSKRNSALQGKYVCEYCDRRFNEYSNLIKHRRIHTGSKPYRCELCGKAFSQSSNLNVHRKRCQGTYAKPTPFSSNQIRKCNNLNYKKKLITKGIQRNWNSIPADGEKEKDVLISGPDENVALHDGISPRVEGIRRNWNSIPADGEKEKDVLISGPAENVALHNGISPRVVERIPNSNTCGQLQYERRIWHENPAITKPENISSSEVSVNHTNLNVFNSPRDSIESLTATSPNQHPNKNEVNNESTQGTVSNFPPVRRRTYPCEYCNRRFNESSNLIKHRRIHTGQRPYKCSFCSKDFTQSSNLNVHKKICKGRYFSKMSSRFESSIKSNRFSNAKSKNELTSKVPRFLSSSSSRIGAFENSSVSSQLLYEDGLSAASTWNSVGPSNEGFNTSSVNGPSSQLYDIAFPSASNEDQTLPNNYLPFSSAQLRNLRGEYARDNLEERSSNGDPFQTKLCSTLDPEDRILPEGNDPDSGSVDLFPCLHCKMSFQNPSLLQKHIQLHTGELRTFNGSAKMKQLTNHHTKKSETYTCEFCQKAFTQSSTFNIHRQTCTKNFSHNIDTSLVNKEDENARISEVTFNSQNPGDFDCQTVNTIMRPSFIKHSAAINNINYIVIDDESEEEDNSEVQENNWVEKAVSSDRISSQSLCKTDLKMSFIKDEPDSYLTSVPLPTFSNLASSEVDSKNNLPEIEPFLSEVLEIKQEPIQIHSEAPSPVNVLNIKQEVHNEDYNWVQVCNQPAISGRLKVEHENVFESETVPILETGLGSRNLETNDQDSVGENENLSLENFESTLNLDVQNTSTSQQFLNTTNQRRSIQRSSSKIQCHLPPCNGRTFKSASAFQIHIRVHNGQKPYVCEICKKSFNERSNYTKHLRIHSGYKPYKCTKCGRDFTQSSNLNVHKRKCQGLATSNAITYSSSSAASLIPNTSTANGIEPGLLEYNQAFSGNANMSSAESLQKQQVSNIRNSVNFSHVSNEFSPNFNLPSVTENIGHNGSIRDPISDVFNHSQDREDVTRYTCELCGQSFAESSHLIKHKSIHASPKSHKCSFCHKAFTQLTNYNLHRAACKRKYNLIRIRNSSVVANSEMKCPNVSPGNSNNSLPPLNRNPSINTPDKNTTSIETDCNQIKSSTYFSKKNESSLIPTSNFQQQNQESMGSFHHSISLFDDDTTEMKVILNESNQNSGEYPKSAPPVVSLEQNNGRSFEERNGTVSCIGLPEIIPPSLPESSDQIGRNLNLSKNENSKVFQVKIAAKSLANPEKVFQCQLRYCRRIFHLASEFKSHMKRHKRRGVHVCKFCNKQFNESSNLVKHRRIHTGSKPYKCEFCNRFFSQSSNRNVHRKSCCKSATRNPGLFLSGMSSSVKTQAAVNPDLLQCEICLQQFKQVSDLYAHKNSCIVKNSQKNGNAIQKNRIESNFNGKSSNPLEQLRFSKPSMDVKEQMVNFRKLNSLAPLSQGNPTAVPRSIPAQKKALSGHYMFQCPYRHCGKIFKMASVLRRHMKDHNDQRQYPCEFCGKKFNGSSNLSKHRRIHTGHKPYHCLLCGRHFTQSSNLNVHRKTCNGSANWKALDFSSLTKDPTGLEPQNQYKLTEKSHSASSLHITGILENSFIKEQSQQSEIYNRVINIEDDVEDNGLDIIEPSDRVSSITISSQMEEGDIGGTKSFEISSDPPPENVLRVGSSHLNIHLKNSQLSDSDVIMIDRLPGLNIQDSDTSEKEPETKSRLIKNFNLFVGGGEDSGKTFGNSVPVHNDTISPFGVTSRIRPSIDSNKDHNSSPSCSIQKMNSSSTSSKSEINFPIYNNNNNNNNNYQKTPMKMPSNNITMNANTPEKSVASISTSPNLFSCNVRSCRKVCKSEQELITHQCKQRTFPCEYCHKRFNESSNLIKHRRIHTGHKPYRCKFCGKNFTQSSNLNVHHKVCGKKHNFVECRVTQQLTRDRSGEEERTRSLSRDARSDQSKRRQLPINLSQGNISPNHRNEKAETSSCSRDDYLDQSNSATGGSDSPDAPSSNSPVAIENSTSIVKLEDIVSEQTEGHQDSEIIVQNSLTGEVKLQISEKELSAFESQGTLPEMTRDPDNLGELENTQDNNATSRFSPNKIPLILKKEVDQLDSNLITTSLQHNTETLETSNALRLESNDICNSNQSISPLSSQLDLVSNSNAQPMRKFNSFTKPLKTVVQTNKYARLRGRGGGGGTYACEYCNRRFNESSNLIKHRRIHTGLRPYQCQFCGKTFTQSSNRNVHKKICAQNFQLSGSVVGQNHFSSSSSSFHSSGINVSSLKMNRTTKRQKTNVSRTSASGNYCNPKLNFDRKMLSNQAANRYSSMMSHDTSSADNGSVSSVKDSEPICSISSVTSLRENPDSHLQFLRNKSDFFDTSSVQDANPMINGFSMPGISKSQTPSSADSNNQPLMPSGGRINSLDAELSASSNLSSIPHFQKYDNLFSSNKKTTPSNPSRNFRQAFALSQNHHVINKYFQCLFCPRLCKNSADFQRHMRVHTGHKPYKCKICNKLFTDYSNLSKHRRVHTGFKPYKCNFCLKAFSQSSNLNVHKKHCKGIQHKSLANLSRRSKVTCSANQIKLNSHAPQIVLTRDPVRSRNSAVSTQRECSSTSGFLTESPLSDLKPQSGLSISKLAFTRSKSAAQRISLKYLNKITSRWNKTLSRDSDGFSKPQIFVPESDRSVNPNVPITEGSNPTIPETMTFNSTLNNFSSHQLPKNDSSYLRMKNIDLNKKVPNLKGQAHSVTEKTNLSTCIIRNKKPNSHAIHKRQFGVVHVGQKHYYCEYCNRKFNESSNLSKHRRIHTGHKPYKCQFCNKRFTQSSNLNVHRKICKTVSENPTSSVQSNSDKNKDETENTSSIEVVSDGQVSEKSSKDENSLFLKVNYSSKQLFQDKKDKDSQILTKVPENESNSQSHINLPAEMSGLKNANQVSRDCLVPNSPKTDHLLGHNEDHSGKSDQTANDPKLPIHDDGLSPNSVSGLSNGEIFISSPKHKKSDVQLEDLSCSNAMDNKSQGNVRNPSSVKKTIFLDESDMKDDDQNCSLTNVESINSQNSFGQDIELCKENPICSSLSDQGRIDKNGLNVRITADSVSSRNQEEKSVVIRQQSLIPPCSRSYNTQESDADPGTIQSDIRQSFSNYNENLNEFIGNDLPDLSLRSQDTNCEYSNPDQSSVLDSVLSNSQLKLSQSQNKNQVHPTCESPFASLPALKHEEDVLYCSDGNMELVQLQSGQSDMLKSIQSAINGILQTEGISSSGDQTDQVLLPNEASDWFKIEPGSDKNQSVYWNNSTNDGSSLEPSNVDQISNLDDDDVIIMDNSTSFPSVKSKFNFVGDVQHLLKSSYPTISEINPPVSTYASSMSEIQPTNKTESEETNLPGYPSDVPSVTDCGIPNQQELHGDQSLLQTGYSQQQFDSNCFVQDKDDDVAIIDIKATLPVKLQNDSNVTSSNLNFSPTYFNTSCKVSPVACKSDMNVLSEEDTITKQTDTRMGHITESFDYLVPNITDQLLSDGCSSKVVDTSFNSKQQHISAEPNCVYTCEFCQDRFLTPNLLGSHCCPNTGDKPYVCPDCGKSFTQYADVISHKSMCLELSGKMADFSVLRDNNINKDTTDRQGGSYGRGDLSASTMNLTHWNGEYDFNPDSHSKMLVHVKNNNQTLKYENNTNPLSEFPSPNIEIALNDYNSASYNNFNRPFPNTCQIALGNKSGHFIADSYTNNNNNSVVDISNILPSSASLPSNNIDPSLTTPATSVPLGERRLPTDNPDFQLHPNKHSLFSGGDFPNLPVNNYQSHNSISNDNTDQNVLLKDLTTELCSDQTTKYSLAPSTTSFLSSTTHSNTTISATLSSSASSSSTSFINVLDPAVTVSSVPCQYCDKMLSLRELGSHTCSGTTQANRYTCTFCEKTLCDASSLNKHLRIHTGQKPYSCEFCGKAFTQSSNLNVHKRVCKDKANPLQTT